MIDVAPGQVIGTGQVVELIAEDAVVTGRRQVQTQEDQAENGEEA